MTDPLETITWAGLVAAFLHLLIVFAVSIRVLTRRRPPGSTAGWLLLVVMLPYGGALLYLLIGERPLGRRRARCALALQAPAERWLADLAGRQRCALPGVIDNWSGIQRLADRAVGIQAMAGNQLALLDDTGQVLRAMIADIEQAEHFCLLEFYIWSPGGRADNVAEALIAAAGRGVTCRVLLDAVGSGVFFASDWPQRFASAGIALQRALPANMVRAFFRRADLRLHRKLLVVDGRVAYTGSLNMVDPRCFKQDAGVGEWVDAMTRVRGPVVEALAGLFAWDWALETNSSLDRIMHQVEVPIEADAGPAVVQMVPSGPGYDGHGVVQLLLAAVYSAERELTLTTPYFIPDDPLVEALRTAAMRGVQVRLVLPARVDSRMVQHASRAYFDDLLSAGVEIHLFDGGLLHTKSVVVDRELVFFGTLNLDIRSFQLNFELTLLVYDGEFAEQVMTLADGYVTNAERLNAEQWAQRSGFQRLTENLYQLVSPLL